MSSSSSSVVTCRFPHFTWETMPFSAAAVYAAPPAVIAPQATAAASAMMSSAAACCTMVRLNDYCRRLVRSSRQQLGYTQTELARKLYLKDADIKVMENGTLPVSKAIVDMVLYTLNIRVVLEENGCYV